MTTHIKLGLVSGGISIRANFAIIPNNNSQVGSTNLSISTSHKLQDCIMEEDVLVLHKQKHGGGYYM